MDWMAETFERRADPKVLWPEARSVVMLAMNYGPAVDPLEALRAYERGRDLGLRAPSRLSRRDQGPPEDARGVARRRRAAREGRGQGLRRHRAGDGEAARARGGPGLAGQAHQSRQPRIRLVAVSRRDLHRPRAAARRGRERSLRRLPRLPRRLPDARVHGALSARRAPLRFLSHHRAQGDDRAGIARRDRQSHLRLRRLSGGLPVEQIRARGARGQARRSATILPTRRSPNSRLSTSRVSGAASPAGRSSASAMRDSCATS